MTAIARSAAAAKRQPCGQHVCSESASQEAPSLPARPRRICTGGPIGEPADPSQIPYQKTNAVRSSPAHMSALRRDRPAHDRPSSHLPGVAGDICSRSGSSRSMVRSARKSLTASRRDFPPRTDRPDAGSPSTQIVTASRSDHPRKNRRQGTCSFGCTSCCRQSACRFPAPQDSARCLVSHSPPSPAAAALRPPLPAERPLLFLLAGLQPSAARHQRRLPARERFELARSSVPARAGVGCVAACQRRPANNPGIRFPPASA